MKKLLPIVLFFPLTAMDWDSDPRNWENSSANRENNPNNWENSPNKWGTTE